MQRRTRLNVHDLERRDVPATFGIPWPDGTAVTCRSPRTGPTWTGRPTSSRPSWPAPACPPRSGRRRSSRRSRPGRLAADLNVGVVADAGSAEGAAGYPQADPRFGDIRIFAVPLSTSELAITTPPGDLAGTRTGDIILNSNYTFGVGRGRPRPVHGPAARVQTRPRGANSADPRRSCTSSTADPDRPLDAATCSRSSSCTARGRRPPGSGHGEQLGSTATPLAGPDPRLTYGDVTYRVDVDWYSFTAPSTGPRPSPSETAGLSLLAGRLTVFNASARPARLATVTGPGRDLTPDLAPEAGGPILRPRERRHGEPVRRRAVHADRGRHASGSPTVTVGGQAPVDDNSRTRRS